MDTITHINGKRIKFPFVLTAEEVDNLAYNSKVGTCFRMINVITRQVYHVIGSK